MYVWQRYCGRGMYGRSIFAETEVCMAEVMVTAEVLWPRYVFTPFCPLWVSLHSPRITWTSLNTNVVTRQPFSRQWDHKWWLTLFSSMETRKNKPREFYKLNNVHFVWIIVQVDWCWHQFNLLFDRMVWLAVRNGENRIIMKSSESPKDDVLLIL